jgi:hypothetical protein
MNHKELIARLKVGASIEREKVVYSGWAPLADEAADAIEALQAECDQLNDDVSMHMRVAVKAIDECVELKAESYEYQQAADKMAWEHKVERDTLRQQLAEVQRDAERYRFLISDASDSNGVAPEQSLLVDEVWQRVLDCGNNYTKDAVDFAIDAAMKGTT